MDLRASRAGYADKLERAASRVVRILSARPEVHRLILVGSVAMAQEAVEWVGSLLDSGR